MDDLGVPLFLETPSWLANQQKFDSPLWGLRFFFLFAWFVDFIRKKSTTLLGNTYQHPGFLRKNMSRKAGQIQTFPGFQGG